jgi:hypothetical protein
VSILSSVVKIADKVTVGLKFQATVTHWSFVSDAGKGDPVEKKFKRKAVVEKKQKLVRTFAGEMAASSTTVTLLKPGVLIKESDRIFLPDGTGGQVIGAGGFVDGSSGQQAYVEAYLG